MCKVDVFSRQTIYTGSFSILQAFYTLMDQLNSNKFSKCTSIYKNYNTRTVPQKQNAADIFIFGVRYTNSFKNL